MTPWIIINAIASVLVVAILTFKLGWQTAKFNGTELLGMGMLGGGMVLNIAPILARGTAFGASYDTPFDDWGSTLIRVGCAIYFTGRMLRHFRHDAANAAQKSAARAHQARKVGNEQF